MRDALHAEWTKLRTVAGTGWLLVATVGLTVAASAATSAVVTCAPGGCDHDPVRVSLSGIALGQAVVAVLAVLSISSEHSSGMFGTTLVAMPRRAVVLGAKALTLLGVVSVAATVAVLGSLLAGRLLLPGNGFTAANGHPPVSLTDGPTLRAAFGSVLYLCLIALLGLGLATAVRDAATAVGTVLGLLFLFPVLSQVATDPDWHRRIEQAAPMTSGLTVQATVGLDDLAIGPWAGLAVLAAWAVAALAIGGTMLWRRDA